MAIVPLPVRPLQGNESCEKGTEECGEAQGGFWKCFATPFILLPTLFLFPSYCTLPCLRIKSQELTIQACLDRALLSCMSLLMTVFLYLFSSCLLFLAVRQSKAAGAEPRLQGRAFRLYPTAHPQILSQLYPSTMCSSLFVFRMIS